MKIYGEYFVQIVINIPSILLLHSSTDPWPPVRSLDAMCLRLGLQSVLKLEILANYNSVLFQICSMIILIQGENYMNLELLKCYIPAYIICFFLHFRGDVCR